MSYIVVEDLIKVYRTGKSEVIALRGMDFTIREGEIVAIMGPSGCGKTTLINIIGGLDTPTAGSVVIDGQNMRKLSSSKLVNHRRCRVGIVFQFFNLIPTLTAKENIELPMRLAEKKTNIIEQRGNELLKLVGMEHRATHKPDELSGGEQQRTGIAVALANDPPLILADEPTGELDSETGFQILQLFKTLKEQYGKTILIVTHDQRIGQIVDRVMIIIDGQITKEMSAEEFKMKPIAFPKAEKNQSS